ncbi:hypothetical protein ACOSQ2_031239 [Xanthoceras sorbifolium]
MIALSNKGSLHWNEFTKAVLHRFGPTDYNDPSETLSRLKQTTSVNTYQEAFEKLSHKVDDFPKNFLVVKQPKTLLDAISVAHLIEERNQFQKRPGNYFRPAASLNPNKPTPSSTVGLLGPPPSQRTGQASGNFVWPVRRITGQEARERREKGLCFYCDGVHIILWIKQWSRNLDCRL